MTALRFIHSADLHLGRRFGALPEDLRGRLVEARHAAIGRLARAARDTGSAHVLLAGDTFDTETPSDPVWRQALVAMGAAADLTWWVIPGNHDSLAAETLWARLAAGAPPNLRLLMTPAAIEMAAGAWLLPAPLPRRRIGRDLTEGLGAIPTPEGALRIGLAHGAVQDFSEDGGGEGIIAPDRAETAGLDYLALGDWHGQIRITPRTWYSGTPERDAFGHAGRGACLAVTVPGPGALPEVAPVETGQFQWSGIALPLLPGEPVDAALAAVLPADRAARRDHLVQVAAEGRATLAGRAALEAAAAEVAADFALFRLDMDRLATEVEVGDLDRIDRAGALRVAADQLKARAEDGAQGAGARAVAAAALNRLYGYLQEGGA